MSQNNQEQHHINFFDLPRRTQMSERAELIQTIGEQQAELERMRKEYSSAIAALAWLSSQEIVATPNLCWTYGGKLTLAEACNEVQVRNELAAGRI